MLESDSQKSINSDTKSVKNKKMNNKKQQNFVQQTSKIDSSQNKNSLEGIQ